VRSVCHSFRFGPCTNRPYPIRVSRWQVLPSLNGAPAVDASPTLAALGMQQWRPILPAVTDTALSLVTLGGVADKSGGRIAAGPGAPFTDPVASAADSMRGIPLAVS
jgi:hypothetical protein